jgi:hypothetical protein
MGGRPFGARAFVNAETAARAFDGGCFGGRADIAVGYRPGENWLALAQVSVDAPRAGEDVVRIQLSLVRFGASGRGLQVGVRARVDHDLDERALVIGWWGRPGE